MTTPIKRQRGRHTFDSSNTRHNVARMLLALQTPQTYKQLREGMHMSERSIQLYVSHLRAEPNRRVRVCKFLFINERWVPVLALGAAPDAVKPKQDEKVRQAKYRAKVKRTPELDAARLRREQARWLRRKATTANVTWMSALVIGRRSPKSKEGAAC